MNHYDYSKYTAIAERFHSVEKIDRADAEWLLRMVETLHTQLQTAQSIVHECCPIASEETDGRYFCTREKGHSGPCATRPETVMTFIREDE